LIEELELGPRSFGFKVLYSNLIACTLENHCCSKWGPNGSPRTRGMIKLKWTHRKKNVVYRGSQRQEVQKEENYREFGLYSLDKLTPQCMEST
jgi:hypothetical protein